MALEFDVERGDRCAHVGQAEPVVIRHERRGEAGQVSLLTLDRPERRNALDFPHWKALADAVRNVGEHGAQAITGAEGRRAN
jgi:enoyl-CoA hydratase/carnithine racemase